MIQEVDFGLLPEVCLNIFVFVLDAIKMYAGRSQNSQILTSKPSLAFPFVVHLFFLSLP